VTGEESGLDSETTTNALFRREVMRFARYSILVAFVAVCATLSAFAKEKNEAKFTLTSDVQVGATQLKPGDYKVTWDGTGSDVQIRILQGKNVVATTSGKLVEKEQPAPYSAVTLSSGPDGTKTLRELSFGNRKEALVFGSAETAQN